MAIEANGKSHLFGSSMLFTVNDSRCSMFFLAKRARNKSTEEKEKKLVHREIVDSMAIEANGKTH